MGIVEALARKRQTVLLLVLIDGEPYSARGDEEAVTLNQELTWDGDVITQSADIRLSPGQRVPRKGAEVIVIWGYNGEGLQVFFGYNTSPQTSTSPLLDIMIHAEDPTYLLGLPNAEGPISFGAIGDGGHPAGSIAQQLLALANVDDSGIDTTLDSWDWTVGTADPVTFNEGRIRDCLTRLLEVDDRYLLCDGQATPTLRPISLLPNAEPSVVISTETNSLRSSCQPFREVYNRQMVRGDYITDGSGAKKTLIVGEAESDAKPDPPLEVNPAPVFDSPLIQTVDKANSVAKAKVEKSAFASYLITDEIIGDPRLRLGDTVAYSNPNLQGGLVGVRGVIWGLTHRIGIGKARSEVRIITNLNQGSFTSTANPIARFTCLPVVVGDPKSILSFDPSSSKPAYASDPLATCEWKVTDGATTTTYTVPFGAFAVLLDAEPTRTVVVSLRVQDSAGRWSLPYVQRIVVGVNAAGGMKLVHHMGLAFDLGFAGTTNSAVGWNDYLIDTGTLGNAVSIAATATLDEYLGGTGGGYVIRSADAWKTADEPVLVEAGASIDALWGDPVSIGLCWAGTSTGKVWKSLDKGKTWALALDLSDRYGAGCRVTRVVSSAYNSGQVTVYGGQSDYRESLVNRTWDFGQNWLSLTATPEWAGWSIPSGTYVTDSGEQDGRIFLALSSGSAVYSNDNALSWHLSPTALSAVPVTATVGLDRAAALMDEDGHVWTAGDMSAAGFDGTLTDEDDPTEHSHGSLVFTLRADPYLKTILWSGESEGLLRLNWQNGKPFMPDGTTPAWKDVRGPSDFPLPDGSNVKQIAFSALGPATVTAVPGQVLLATYDTTGHDTYLWAFVQGIPYGRSLPAGVDSVLGLYTARGGNRFFLLDNSGGGGASYGSDTSAFCGVGFYSDDVGLNWVPLPAPPSGMYLNDLCPVSDSLVYATAQAAGSEGGSFVDCSILKWDGGSSWVELWPASHPSTTTLRRIKARADMANVLVAFGSHGGGGRGVVSIDGGATWSAFSEGVIATVWGGDLAVDVAGSLWYSSNRDGAGMQLYRSRWNGSGYGYPTQVKSSVPATDQTLIPIPEYDLRTALTGGGGDVWLLAPDGSYTALTPTPATMVSPGPLAYDSTNRVLYRGSRPTLSGSTWGGPVWFLTLGGSTTPTWKTLAAAAFAALVSGAPYSLSAADLLVPYQRWIAVTG